MGVHEIGCRSRKPVTVETAALRDCTRTLLVAHRGGATPYRSRQCMMIMRRSPGARDMLVLMAYRLSHLVLSEEDEPAGRHTRQRGDQATRTHSQALRQPANQGPAERSRSEIRNGIERHDAATHPFARVELEVAGAVRQAQAAGGSHNANGEKTDDQIWRRAYHCMGKTKA